MIQANTPNIVELVESFAASQLQVFPQHTNRASSAGHPCERFLVYCRLNSQERALPDLGRAFVFSEGNMHEREVLLTLAKAGLAVTESQRSFEWKDFELTGKIDGIIVVDGKKYPLEIKSMEPFGWAALKSVEDIKHNSKYYVRGYFDQMQLYLLMSNFERGIMLFKNKVNGRLKQINVEIDYAYAEALLKKLERINALVKAKTYPDRPIDRTPCHTCDFRHICLPDEDSASMQVEDNSELLALIEQRETLKGFAKEFEQVDEAVKEIFKPRALGAYLIGGKFQVKVAEMKRKFLNVPDADRAKYEEEKVFQKINITPLK